MNTSHILLLILLALGVVSNNHSVSIAVAVLLLIRLIHADFVFPYLESYGIQIGIIVLTIGVLAPIASGKIGTEELVSAVRSPAALLGIAAGVIVSYLGGKGVGFLTAQPLAVNGILIGTLAGVALFKGVPVGPLIAAGGLAVVMQLFQR